MLGAAGGVSLAALVVGKFGRIGGLGLTGMCSGRWYAGANLAMRLWTALLPLAGMLLLGCVSRFMSRLPFLALRLATLLVGLFLPKFCRLRLDGFHAGLLALAQITFNPCTLGCSALFASGKIESIELRIQRPGRRPIASRGRLQALVNEEPVLAGGLLVCICGVKIASLLLDLPALSGAFGCAISSRCDDLCGRQGHSWRRTRQVCGRLCVSAAGHQCGEHHQADHHQHSALADATGTLVQGRRMARIGQAGTHQVSAVWTSRRPLAR